MKIIEAPLRFPGNVEYVIHGRNEFSRVVRDLLLVLCPSSRFHGLVDDDFDSAGCVHLLPGPDWSMSLARLRKRGVSEDRLMVMPVPVGEIWSWWRFAVSVKDDLVFGEGRVDLPPDVFMRHLVEIGRGRIDAGRAIIQPDLYGCFFKDLWRRNDDRIACVRDNLSGQASRNNYDMVINGSPEVLWQYYIENVFKTQQYADHVGITPGDVILNGGIAGGSEVALFLGRLDGTGHLYNIDPLGHDFLGAHAAASVEYYDGLVTEVRVALADREGVVSLPVGLDNQALGKHRGETLEMDGFKTCEFPCTRVDNLVDSIDLERVDLIKLDLEGAEEYVLEGMMNAMNRFRPQLALSIYHKPSHLFELPSLLMERLSGYSYFVEIYSFERWEVVLYCIPNERRGTR